MLRTWPPRSVGRLASALAVIVALCVLPARAGAGTLPGLLTMDGSDAFAVRPPSIGYTGDGTGVIGKLPARPGAGRLDWEVWSDRVAYGVGTVWLDDCTPDCAQGGFHAYSGRVLADRVVDGHFTRMTILIEYGTHYVTDIRVLRRAGPRSYQWAILSQVGFPP